MKDKDSQLIAEAYLAENAVLFPQHYKSENQEAPEGAVNLLEQLKGEAPELEDKINQILEKVFDAVDVLKQESYVDDPELRKAHDSLIEGDF